MDYSTMDHTIAVDSFRAGNHDESGVNEYAFDVNFYGLVNTVEERKKKSEERRKIHIPKGQFHELTLPSLKFWKPDEKTREGKKFKISGDSIREIIAQTMTEFEIAETDVAIQAEIVLYESGKQFYFFGEDTKVASTHYYPIPPTRFSAPARTNLSLLLVDDKGTEVQLSIEYDQPLDAPKGDKDEGPGEGGA